MSRRHYTLDECKAFALRLTYHDKTFECEPAKSIIEEGDPLPLEVALPYITPMFGGWSQVPGTDCLTQSHAELVAKVIRYIKDRVRDEQVTLRKQIVALEPLAEI